MNNSIFLSAMLMVILSGCSSAVAPVPTTSTKDAILKAATQAIEQGTEIPPGRIEELRRNGLEGLISFTIRGSKNYQGPALFSPNIQNPQTLEWQPLPRSVVELTEEKGTGFILATSLEQAPDLQLRYMVEIKLPSGTRYGAEIASGGVALRVEKQAKQNEALVMTFAPLDANELDLEKKESFWEITTKQQVFDAFVDKTVLKETTRTLPRKDTESLWLRLKHNEIEIYSAATLKEMNEREKPDLVLGAVSTVVMKRVDPEKKGTG